MDIHLDQQQLGYKALIDVINIPTFITTPDGDIIDVNPAFLEFFNYDKEDLESISAHDLFHIPQEREFFKSLIEEKGFYSDREVIFKDKQGQIKFCLETAVALQGMNGDIIAYQGMLKDVTYNRQIEEQIHILQQAVKQSANAVIITDHEGKITYVNPEFSKLTGYTTEEVINKNPNILSSGKQSDKFYKDLWRTITSGKVWKGTFVNQKKSGQFYWVSTTIAPIKNSNGKISHFVGIQDDVTDKIEYQKTIEQMMLRFQTIFEQANIGIVLLNKQKEVIDMNSYFENLIDYTLEEFSNISMEEVTHPDDLELSEEVTRDVMKGKIGFIEKRYIRKDGSTVWAEITYSRARLMDQDVYLLLALNIDERMKMREKNKMLQDHLLQAKKMEAIGQLAGGIAHDFNNLLTIIISNVTILKDVIDDEYGEKMVDEIKVASDRATKIISRLLNYARKKSFKMELVDPHELIHETTEMLRPAIKPSISIRLQFEAENIVINADTVELSNVLMNLALNAQDAMPHGGDIIFRTSSMSNDNPIHLSNETILEPGNYFVIEIEDEGVGMNEETKSRLFDPFFSTKKEGTGLGLASAQGTILDHHGNIEVESIENIGTTFTIYLPISEEKLPDSHRVDLRPKPKNQHSKTIMIVDDEQLILNSISKILVKHNYNPILYQSPLNAINSYSELYQKIDLCIIDLSMPEMSGIELINNLKQINPDLKSILYSGYLDIDLNGEQIDSNIIANVTKPFNVEDLITTIDNYFDNNP